MRIKRTLATVAAAALATTGLVACSNESDDTTNAEGGDDTTTVKIGTTEADQEAWRVFKDLAADNGITLDIVSFSDYSPVNEALAQGELDVNKFQHIKYLAEYNKASSNDLRVVGSTEIVPLALFWKDHDSLDGIDGEEIAIPNDTTNQARAINLLKQKGLVELKPDAPLSPQPNDIDKDKSKVKVAPVGAEQTSSAYSEGKPAVINNSFLDRAGIDPHSAVAQDDPKSKEAEPYINVFAVRSEDADNQELKDLAALWHSDEVQKAVEEDSAGTSIPVDRSAEELQDILKRLEEETDGADANASK